jgi:H+/gluconate symporter-like permease
LIVTCSEGIKGHFLDGLLIGLLNAIVFILLNGMLFVWLAERNVHVEATLPRKKRDSTVFNKEQKRSKGSLRLAPLLTQLLLSRVGYGVLSALFDGIFVGFLIEPVYGLVNGLYYALFFGLLGRLDKKIQPAEILVWSWTSVRHNAMKSLITGLCIGFFYGFFSDVQHLFNVSVFLPSLFFGLITGIVLAVLIMLIGGFSRNMLDTRSTMKPNQGI